MAAAATQSLSSLLQRSTLDDHEEVLKACNAALKKSKHDTEAQYVRVVALIKLDRFDDALRAIEEGGDALKARGQLEWAYALYKTGKLEEATGIASRASDRGSRHVEAQASYRAENFERTSQIYRKLEGVKSSFIHEENDLRINQGALDAQLEWKGYGDKVQKKKPSREDLEAFETAYNAACGSIARGELSQAEILLKRAKDLCRSSEDLSDEEKTAELVPISVQQIFVYSRLGKVEEAEKLASEITLSDLEDLSTSRVAQNNLLTVSSKPSNPFLSHKLFHATPASSDSDKLFDFQSKIFKSNGYSVDLQALKYDGVAKSTSKAILQHSSPTPSTDINSLCVHNAAARARNEIGKQGLKQILPVLETRPNDVGLMLTIIQLYVLLDNPGSAIILLETFFKRLDDSISESDQDVRFNPGLIGILIALYKSQGRKKQIKTELLKASSYWRENWQRSRSKIPFSLFQAAGVSLLESSNQEDLANAGTIFSGLHRQNPTERSITAGLVASYATTNYSEIASEVEKLTPINDLVAGIDVQALEDTGIPQPASSAATAFSSARKRGAEDSTKPAKKRIRKSRLPKDYDPDKKPDPERWLPLRDRSSYRPKGKKGKQKAAERTQGGVAIEKVDEKSSKEGDANSKVITAQKLPGGGGGANVKKKKGKGKK